MKKIRSSTPEVIFLAILGMLSPSILLIQGGILLKTKKFLLEVPETYGVIHQIANWFSENHFRIVSGYQFLILVTFCVIARLFINRPYHTRSWAAAGFFFDFLLHVGFSFPKDPNQCEESTISLILAGSISISILAYLFFRHIYKNEKEQIEDTTGILDVKIS